MPLNSQKVSNAAEIYNPKTGKFTLTGSFNEQHDTTSNGISGNGILLPNSKVFFVGLPGKHAELYDHKTGVFVLSDSMAYARHHSAVTLIDSKNVLLIGGLSPTKKTRGFVDDEYSIRQTEIFDSSLEKFFLGKLLPILPSHKSLKFIPSVILEDIKIPILLGTNSVIYSYQSNTYTPIIKLPYKFEYHDWYKFSNKDFWLSSTSGLFDRKPIKSFDVDNNKKTSSHAKYFNVVHNIIFITGGATHNVIGKFAALYDHSRQKLYNLPNMIYQHSGGHTFTKLNSKKYLICGGTSYYGNPLSNKCEIFNYTYTNVEE